MWFWRERRSKNACGQHNEPSPHAPWFSNLPSAGRHRNRGASQSGRWSPVLPVSLLSGCTGEFPHSISSRWARRPCPPSCPDRRSSVLSNSACESALVSEGKSAATVPVTFVRRAVFAVVSVEVKGITRSPSQWRLRGSLVRIRPRRRVSWFASVKTLAVSARWVVNWGLNDRGGAEWCPTRWLSRRWWCFGCVEGRQRRGERCDQTRRVEQISDFFCEGTDALRFTFRDLTEAM